VVQVAADFPEICTLHEIGTSFKGRPLRVLQIKKGTAPKPGIFIDSAMHAREWIGPPVAIYAINQLTEFFDQNSFLLDEVDFFIMPIVNPDGYLHTWNVVITFIKCLICNRYQFLHNSG
jgi:murein tripeptide amidase MpaA